METMRALERNGIRAELFEDGEGAKARALSLVPKGASVLTATSITLDSLGISKDIDGNLGYASFRERFRSIGDADERLAARRALVNPDFALGSVQAVTRSGHLFFATKSGSQLPAYAYSAGNVILVVGTQKIVKDDAEAVRRIEERCVPMEQKRMMGAYGIGTSFNKMLVIRREDIEGRTRVLFVNREVGF